MKHIVTTKKIFILLFGLCLLTMLFCFIYQADAKPTKRCTLNFEGNIILTNVPLAETQAQKEKGLSGKNPVSHGMFFTVPTPQPLTFWMKDTITPLSIGFISKDGILFQIEDMLPETETFHISKEDAIAALELPLGGFTSLGLQVGSRLVSCDCEAEADHS